MLSYQHAYHAGNLADVHKHALLAVALARLTDKPKPLSYLETHAGRGLYDLRAPEALRTGEAAAGIGRVLAGGWFPPGHPLAAALHRVRHAHGVDSYPGSPLIAAHFLRPDDSLHLAELHPGEFALLQDAISGMAPRADLRRDDGFAFANALLPPLPRRGMLLVDPSYEIKADYDRLPGWIARMARKWNVGVIALWYPLLADDRHRAMVTALAADHPGALLSEVRFAPARPGHGMTGSGMFVINPPWGLADEAARLGRLYAGL
ncbi:23S rRNA (adenine(2030)-N(6))-methyltransferase RlmJ [Paracoccus contaminans]|uniref:Ribosomal RNA large subunit methyltransferase J n=1 Tax=Paracoccus contaminans TaxID=1945662 RepID=A0A1W6CUW4_9RHOB|nr:23S rRNA (adenine(2030)-N(6))-methyltransferase RlmJ [Paracoccus contaminans]ARJ68641.1 23S rRNA (adenine(2030)-N(6))-methyltransferase RlmJ [Paracoccus contaminans]